MYGLYGQLLLIAAQFVFDGFPAMQWRSLEPWLNSSKGLVWNECRLDILDLIYRSNKIKKMLVIFVTTCEKFFLYLDFNSCYNKFTQCSFERKLLIIKVTDKIFNIVIFLSNKVFKRYKTMLLGAFFLLLSSNSV